jgi:hypothetical protein
MPPVTVASDALTMIGTLETRHSDIRFRESRLVALVARRMSLVIARVVVAHATAAGHARHVSVRLVTERDGHKPTLMPRERVQQNHVIW